MSTIFTYKIFNKLDRELEKNWNELEKNGKFFFFQKYNYVLSHIKNFDMNLLNIVVIYENNVPIAIFPFEIKNFKGLRVLQWLGSNHFDYCCPIITDRDIFNYQNFNFIFQKILNKIKDYDIVFLNKQPEYIEKTSNPFVKFLDNDFHSKVYQIHLKDCDEDLLEVIKNKKFTNEFKRTKKKLLESNHVEFSNSLFKNDDKMIEKIILNKINYLNKRKISHKINKDFIEFYKYLNDKCPKNLFIGILKINGIEIAANIGIIENQRYYYLLPIIFSDKFKSFSPGKILIHNLINWAKKNGVKTFDFGIGEEIYKKYWSNFSSKVFRYLDFKGFKGLSFYLLIQSYLKLKSAFKKP